MATKKTSTKKPAAAKPAAKPKPKARKKRVQRQVSVGQAHVRASYNNTIVTISDAKGDVLAWSSSGSCGFRGPKKATPYAATVVIRELMKKIEGVGLREVEVFVRGVGSGRESSIRALHANGIVVTRIKDVTPIPHNGCRPRKARRI
jgi:small subunit ribosomal protein S11